MMSAPAPPAAAPVRRDRYYLGPTFVVEHRPTRGEPHGTAIVLLPPMGYEDVCAHRPLRVLAEALAAAGHLVLHLDWPGLGDSALDDSAPDLPDHWIRAAEGAAESLRARGYTHIAGVGVRAGALIAIHSASFDELVLWAMPASGRTYLREERVFERMSAPSLGKAFEGPKQPEGTVEAAGFVYRPETVAGLEKLLSTTGASARRARVLLIERDGATSPAGLLDAFENAGTPVSHGPAVGLGDLLERPYKAHLDPNVLEAILGWFAAGKTALQGTARRPGGATRLTIEHGCSERPWVERGGVGELSGVVCEPAGGARPGQAWTLFFNAGGMRRAGPNRLWTTAARALAARGVPSLRFDVRDVGDSDGTAIPFRDLDGMYSEASIGDALVAFDWVNAQGAAAIDVVGLCSGAYLGMQVASRRKVRRALLFNGLAYVWNDDARASDMTSEVGRSLFDRRRWGRLLSGRIDAKELARSLATKARVRLANRVARMRGLPPVDEVAELIRSVTERGTDLHLVSSDGDPSIEYLNAHTTPSTRPRLTILPGIDHTIRPVWAHARVIELVMETACPTRRTST